MKFLKGLLVLLIGMVSLTSFAETTNDATTNIEISDMPDVVMFDTFTSVSNSVEMLNTNDFTSSNTGKVYLIPYKSLKEGNTYSNAIGTDTSRCYNHNSLEFASILIAVDQETYNKYLKSIEREPKNGNSKEFLPDNAILGPQPIPLE